MEKKNKIWVKHVLILLLVLQFVLSIGALNEFEDYLVFAIIALSFSALQIPLLFLISEKRSALVLILLISTLHFFVLMSFLNDSTNNISNSWPKDFYYATYGWVIAMLTGILASDAAKLSILYRQIIVIFLLSKS